jgi:hypothetical protein
MDKTWFAVKTVFRLDVHARSGDGPRCSAFEERIVLLLAPNAEAALEAGELEAKQYSAEGSWPNQDGESVTTRYLGACDAFALTGTPGDGVEIFSRVLYVNAVTTDAAIVDRMFGGEGELHSTSQPLFEPDFERMASAKPDPPPDKPAE